MQTPELHVRLKPSIVHAFITLGLLIAGAIALFTNSLFSLPLKIAIGLVLLLLGYDWCRRCVLLNSRNAVVALAYREDSWFVRHPYGDWQHARLVGPVSFNRLFIVLRFRTSSGTLPVVLGLDSLGDRNFRRCSSFFRLGDYGF